MWAVMIVSYITVALIDTGKLKKTDGRAELFIYAVLMAVSCTLGILNGYVPNMPSPANPIKNLVLKIMGS